MRPRPLPVQYIPSARARKGSQDYFHIFPGREAWESCQAFCPKLVPQIATSSSSVTVAIFTRRLVPKMQRTSRSERGGACFVLRQRQYKKKILPSHAFGKQTRTESLKPRELEGKKRIRRSRHCGGNCLDQSQILDVSHLAATFLR